MKYVWLLLLLAGSAFGQARSVTITALDDSYINSLATTTKYATCDTLVANSNSTYAILIKPTSVTTVYNAIGAGYVMDSGYFLIMNKTSGGVLDEQFETYEIVRTWIIGTVCASTSGDGATWTQANSGNNWGTAGCQNTTTDRSSSSMGGMTVAAGVNDRYDTARVSAAVLTKWYNQTTVYGVKIAASISVGILTFYATEHTGTDKDPQLVVWCHFAGTRSRQLGSKSGARQEGPKGIGIQEGALP